MLFLAIGNLGNFQMHTKNGIVVSHVHAWVCCLFMYVCMGFPRTSSYYK